MTTTSRPTRRQFLQGIGMAATGAVIAACAPPTAPQASGDGAAMETPEVWFASSNPCPGGGDPERTQAVQELVLEETGVMVNAHILPPGTARTEKLNLLIASGTQPLDLFTGNWPDFKGITLPLDDLLEVHGTDHPGRTLRPRLEDDEGCRGHNLGLPPTRSDGAYPLPLLPLRLARRSRPRSPRFLGRHGTRL